MDNLPLFLESFGDLQNHFQAQFDGLNAYERGERFADFAQQLIPLTQSGQKFDYPEKQSISHDGGVDFVCRTNDAGRILLVQVKYTIRDKGDFDSIISKFRDYFKQNFDTMPLFAHSGIEVEGDADTTKVQFQILSMHKLDRIVELYENAQFASLAFYNQLKELGHIEIVDGPKVLALLRGAYQKMYNLPTNFVINFETPYIHQDSVSLGIISSEELKRLYSMFGDALFYENIRDFLGETSGKKHIGNRITVNQRISETARNEPQKMLSRNNGITIKARKAEQVSDTEVRLFEASIVNGCQTTVSIVNSADQTTPCFVSAKIVEIDEAWDIAYAANHQNNVSELDLRLARYLRRQSVGKVAEMNAVKLEDADSAFSVLGRIYDKKVTYDEMRSLFVGIFSRTPNNLWETNYTELRDSAVLQRFYSEDPDGRFVLETLFELQMEATNAFQKIHQSLGDEEDIYQRFFRDDKPEYRAFLILVAAAAVSGIDISDRGNSTEAEYEMISNFLTTIRRILNNNPESLEKYCIAAFKSIVTIIWSKAEDREAALRDMHKIVSGAKFESLLRTTKVSVSI